MKKRAITLIEIMIVIFIIGLIGSVIGYNMKGSLDEGKAFKCEQGSKQVYDFIQLQMAQRRGTLDEVIENPKEALEATGFVARPDKLLKDGWNKEYVLEKIEDRDGKGPDFVVYSQNWYNFLKKKKKMSEVQMQEEYPWAFYFDKEESGEEE